MEIEGFSKTPTRVSFIIPTLGFTTYVKQAVESLGDLDAQRAEVIIVVDGERQDVPKWLTEMQAVRLLSTGARGGSAAAINLGVRHSTSEYIGRLDADDLSRPGRIARQLDFLDRYTDVALVGTAADIINEEGIRLGAFNAQQNGDPRLLLLRSNPFVHSSFMLRRTAFDAIGGYNEKCIRMQDYDVLLRLALNNRLHILPDILVDYRVHEAQTSKNLHGFVPLMITLSRRKIALAKVLGRSTIVQLVYDIVFSIGQGLRYLGIRKPRYLGRIAREPRNGTG